MATRRSLKALADRLISTLDTPADKDVNDQTIKEAAEELYTDLLQIKGKVVVDPSVIGKVTEVNGDIVTYEPILKFRFEAKK